ncbi:MAG: hypothetical protein D6819_11005 [Gammaproteobacteria bacterium]|nr:MAG: hypothetical protein D6819_11005 [Gammaproteobacteria bacterium]
MKRFFCRCGQELFFESHHCAHCGRLTGFDPLTLEMVSLQGDGHVPETVGGRQLRYCGNKLRFDVCNWLTEADHPSGFCLACHCNRFIPNLRKPVNRKRWRALEQAKKRLAYSLLMLGLGLVSKWDDPDRGLWFDFLEDKRSDEEVAEGFVATGHAGGVITINVLEADDPCREAMRESLNEPYRTLLGHFRHESGHYYWRSLIGEVPARIEAFRALFGDERRPYDAALHRYYVQGPQLDWGTRFVSAYASAHPLEDWAESWSHYLHMIDTLETARAYGLTPPEARDAPFEQRAAHWMSLTLALNALNRSMGLPDAYPFALSRTVRDKLAFIDTLLRGRNEPQRLSRTA